MTKLLVYLVLLAALVVTQCAAMGGELMSVSSYAQWTFGDRERTLAIVDSLIYSYKKYLRSIYSYEKSIVSYLRSFVL